MSLKCYLLWISKQHSSFMINLCVLYQQYRKMHQLRRRSLVGCSPWGRQESDRTERLHFHFSLSCLGEGNGNPLQCSCLENLRDGGAWWAAISGVAQSRTRLKRLSSNLAAADLGKYTFHYYAHFLFINQLFIKMLHILKLFLLYLKQYAVLLENKLLRAHVYFCSKSFLVWFQQCSKFSVNLY